MSTDLNTEIVASRDDNNEKHPDGVEKKSSETFSTNPVMNEEHRPSEGTIQEELENVFEERLSVKPNEDISPESKPDENLPEKTEENQEERPGEMAEIASTRSQDTLMSKIRGSRLSMVSTATEKASDILSAQEISVKQDEESVQNELISFRGSYTELLGGNPFESELEEVKLEDMFTQETVDEARNDDTKDSNETTLMSIEPDVSVGARYVEAFIDKDEFLTGLIPSPSIRTRHSTVASSSSSSGTPPVDAALEDVKIDRKLYTQLYVMYTEKCRDLRRRNNYYQTKMADYYMRRRMFHVLYTDPKSTEEHQKRYGKLLEELETVHDKFTREQGDGESEIENLKNKFRFRKGELDALFEKFQKQEHEVAKEMMASKDDAAKEVAIKFIDRYLKRQKHGLAFLTQIRLAYIKLHNKVHETQDLLDSLDNLGPNLRVMDYQQLKNDDRTLSDKLEEKEVNLNALRQKCQNSMQILAHSREKLFALNKDIDAFNEELEEITGECMDVREQIAALKYDRDEMRREILKFKEQIGLLGKPKLLRHMSQAIEEVEQKKRQLQGYITGVKNVAEEIRMLKRKSSTVLAQQDASQESLHV